MGDAARQQRPRIEGELRDRVRAALAQAFLAALRQPLPANDPPAVEPESQCG